MGDYCSRCKTTEGKFIKNAKGTNGRHYYYCTDCAKEKMRRYYATDKGRERVRAANHKSMKKFDYKQQARNAVNNEIRMGRMVRPATCSICESTGKIQGHHEDYSKPLEVIWACRSCHADLDRKLEKVYNISNKRTIVCVIG